MVTEGASVATEGGSADTGEASADTGVDIQVFIVICEVCAESEI